MWYHWTRQGWLPKGEELKEVHTRPKGKYKDRVCFTCEKSFLSIKPNAKYCSETCKNKDHNERKK